MKNLKFILLVVVILIFALCCDAYVKRYTVQSSVGLAVKYLISNTMKSGRFVYSTNPDDENKYNVLRHTGTLYSMSVYQKFYDTKILSKERNRATKFLLENYVKEVQPNMFVVISKRAEEKGEVDTAKLGASSMALLALTDYYGSDVINKNVIDGLGNFILFMQNDDGSFAIKYIPSQKKKISPAKGKYYFGAPAYALLALNEVNPQQKFVVSAKKSLLFVAKSRKDKYPDTYFDHWGMIAFKKLLQTPNNTLTEEETALLKNDAKLQAEMILRKQIKDKNNAFFGSMYNNHRTASIATVMEGLSAIYYIVDDEQLKSKILTSLKDGNEFLARYQYKYDLILKAPSLIGGVPSDARCQYEDDSEYAAVRIDNVHHALSAWVLYLDVLKNKLIK